MLRFFILINYNNCNPSRIMDPSNGVWPLNLDFDLLFFSPEGMRVINYNLCSNLRSSMRKSYGIFEYIIK